MNKFLTLVLIVWFLTTTMTAWTNVYATTGDTSSDAALDSVISWLLEESTTETTATNTTENAITDEDTGPDLDSFVSETSMEQPTNDSEVTLDNDNSWVSVSTTDIMVEPENYDSAASNTSEWVDTNSENISAWNDVATPRTSASTNRLSSAWMGEMAAIALALLFSLWYVIYQRRKTSI